MAPRLTVAKRVRKPKVAAVAVGGKRRSPSAASIASASASSSSSSEKELSGAGQGAVDDVDHSELVKRRRMQFTPPPPTLVQAPSTPTTPPAAASAAAAAAAAAASCGFGFHPTLPLPSLSFDTIGISTTPPKPDRPAVPAAAAAAAAAAVDDGVDALECDEKELPVRMKKTLSDTIAVYTTLTGQFIGLVPHQMLRQSMPTEWSSATANGGSLSAAERMANSAFGVDALICTNPRGNTILRVVRSRDGAPFAMKLIPDHSRDNAAHWSEYIGERKAVSEALRACSWKHVVQHYAIQGPTDDTPCITVRMDLAGHSMAHDFDAGQALNLLSSLETTAQDMLLALAEIHSLGIVHGAVRLSNFLLDHDTGRYKLSDFEVAALGVPMVVVGKRSVTATSACRSCDTVCPSCELGTITHMHAAPVASARGIITSEMDIWDVGVLLATICLGHAPFGHQVESDVRACIDVHFADETKLYDRIRTALAVWLSPAKTEQFVTLLGRMLTRNPIHRIDAEGALRYPFFAPVQPVAAYAPAAAVAAAAAAAGAASAVPAAAAAAAAAPRVSAADTAAAALIASAVNTCLDTLPVTPDSDTSPSQSDTASDLYCPTSPHSRSTDDLSLGALMHPFDEPRPLAFTFAH